VLSTRIHQQTDPKISFAIAVDIYPYVNSVASVWVYIAALTRP
jgi:hypothetical protein